MTPDALVEDGHSRRSVVWRPMSEAEFRDLRPGRTRVRDRRGRVWRVQAGLHVRDGRELVILRSVDQARVLQVPVHHADDYMLLAADLTE